MSTTLLADKLLSFKSGNVDRYKRNYLRQAVCEMRFPTLMSLGGPKPPADFVSALRKDYPHLELNNEVTINLGATSGTDYSHVFRSVKLNWTVTLKLNAVVVETSRYTEYAEMRERVLKVVNAARAVIDSDFFTRVGLRYINVVQTGQGQIAEWVNPALVGPLIGGHFTGVHEYAGKLALQAVDGGCLLQHGIRHKADTSNNSAIPDYVLDIDTYRNEVIVDDTSDALDAMHSQGFAMFDWALCDKSRAYLASEA